MTIVTHVHPYIFTMLLFVVKTWGCFHRILKLGADHECHEVVAQFVSEVGSVH